MIFLQYTTLLLYLKRVEWFISYEYCDVVFTEMGTWGAYSVGGVWGSVKREAKSV